MKIYVSWESEKIFKTEVEAIDYMVANEICDNFGEYLSDELELSVEEIFALGESEKERICNLYHKYLNEVLQEWCEIVII